MHRPPHIEELLTPAEVAALFGVDPKTVARWATAKHIRVTRTIGGHRRYYKADIDRELERRQRREAYEQQVRTGIRSGSQGRGW